MYATKRRRRNVKTFKHAPKENQKSNPSKRHRERLNTELENLANLLPFEQTILTKLDKLSILRLAVSYLRIKSYFQVKLKISNYLSLSSNQQHEHERNRYPQLYYMDPKFSEGNAILDSLNGFILISNSNSEVFYSSRTVEQFLGFHQSDIIHQSIYELIHSEDREEFKRQLSWNLKLPTEMSDLSLNELLSKKEYAKYLERNFTVRFRCLLDNTSGFVTLDIIGRIGILHGQKNAIDINSIDNDLSSNGLKQTSYKPKNSKLMNPGLMHNNGDHIDAEPTLALFAIAVPFGPPSLFELPQRDSLFRTKHKVNLAPLTLDQRGKLILGYTEKEFSQFGGYDLVHMDDLKYYANAHKELLKTGSSGLVCYRISNKDRNWQWIQTSMRIIYKSNKPECIIANHRPLTSEEGEELYYKRGLEFKLPYLCLYDFEANFNTIGNTYPSNNNNQLNDDSCTLGKTISTNSRLNTNLSNTQVTQVTNKLCQPTTVSLKSISSNGPKPSKISKNSSKVANKHQQNQKFFNNNNNTALMSRNDNQIASATDAGYFNGLCKMENLANNYALYETPGSTQGSTLSISNDYQSFTDNAHYNYTNYLNSLNSYNYTNYTTPHTSYSIYTNPHAHSSNQQLVNGQNEQLIFNTSNNNQITTTTTTPSSSSTWFEEASQPTSKLGQSAYSLINYTNNTNNQNGYKYNDLFNCTTQGTAVGKYSSSSVVDNFDKTTSTSYYLDDYHHNNPSHHTSLNSNSNLYDYSKYNQNSLISKSASTSTTTSSNDNINSNFNGNILKKEQQNFLHTSPPVSIKTSSTTSSSSSTSPTILSSQTSINTNLQDHNNNTNSLFLQNSELNGLSNGLYKKYENFQNDLKIQSSNPTDRNSLHSFSTSSSCSSSTSSSSNYCDDSAVKSFIKQENCVLELAVGLNNATNGIRNGFIMDYYSDFYQNNVTI